MKKLIICFLCCLSLLLAACGKKENTIDGEMELIKVYFLNTDETKISSQEMTIPAGESIDEITSIVTILQQDTNDAKIKSPIAGNMVLLSCNLDEGKIYLNFDEGYRALSKTTEVLTRAALVRTFCQVEGATSVVIQVEGENLTDSAGNLIGEMTADAFIDNEGKEINTYEEATLKLYFTNETGDGLVAVERVIGYNSNISLEKLVMEQLIGGPNLDGVYPTVNSSTKVISVTVADRVCYVNLDENFLTQVNNVTAEVSVFSIVNSLIELPDVRRVQISVNGETEILVREMISLDTIFERNSGLIVTQ